MYVYVCVGLYIYICLYVCLYIYSCAYNYLYEILQFYISYPLILFLPMIMLMYTCTYSELI